MGKNIGKTISKNLSGKYSQKFLDHANESATDLFKTASKIAEATGDLIGNKIADAVAKAHDGEITKISKNSLQNNSETVSNELTEIEINDDARGTYNTNRQIKFKTLEC